MPTFWLLKVTVVGARLGSPAPVPERVAVCGLFVALSVSVSDALRAPAALGVNVTLMAQVAPAATLAPQVFVCAKSVALVPVKPTVVMLNAVLCELVSVTAWAALVVPTFWLPKVSEVGERLGGAVPVPVRLVV